MVAFPAGTDARSVAVGPETCQPQEETSHAETSPPPPPPAASAGTSPIESLPYDVLVLIARQLERPGLALLCQTSRTMRAWSTHLVPQADLSPRSWTHLERASYRESFSQKKELCSKCRTGPRPEDLPRAKKMRFNQALHCSVCDADHPLVLFSARQRGIDSWKRKCRLHESHLPVCSHFKLHYQDIARWKHRRRCNHPSHLVPRSHWPQLFSPAAWRQRWEERPGVRFVRPALSDPYRHSIYDERRDIDIEVHRSHDLLVLKKGELPTVPKIRAALRKLEAKGTFKLCPHVDLTDPSVTACNPDQCPCLITADGGLCWPTGLHVQQRFGVPKYHTRWLFDDWWFPDVDQSREDYIRWLNPADPTIEPDPPRARRTYHVSFQKCCASTTSIYADPSNPRVIRISYTVAAADVSPQPYGIYGRWGEYVDPASSGIGGDAKGEETETKHLFWCSDRECSRYWRQKDLHTRFMSVILSGVRNKSKCQCKIPYWAMSPSQYDLRYDPKREQKDLDHDTYYDGIRDSGRRSRRVSAV